MDGLHLYAALCHHIGSHGGIDAPGQQAHGSAAHPGGQTARAGLRGAVDIGSQIPDLHIHGVRRMMHVHPAGGMGFRQPAADFLGNADGIQRERLVGALGLHLEGFRTVQIVAQIALNGFKNGVQVLLTGTAAAQAHHTEDGFAGIPGAVHIRFFVHGLHIHRRLHEIHIKIAVGLHSAADILSQAALKLTLVGTLQHHLAQLHQENFVHSFFLS